MHVKHTKETLGSVYTEDKLLYFITFLSYNTTRHDVTDHDTIQFNTIDMDHCLMKH